MEFYLVLFLLATFSGKIFGVSISLSCPDQEVPLHRFVQYSCLIQNGSSDFLVWTISRFTSQNISLSFTKSQPVGRTAFSEGFGATLTERNIYEIESVLSFNVTNDHNTTIIFCEGFNPDETVGQCSVNIQGPPGPISSVNINQTLVTWSRPNDETIIEEYEVSINGVIYRTSDTQLLVILSGLTDVMITAIDNAGRPGVDFSRRRDISRPTKVDVSFADRLVNNSGIQASWESEPNPIRPAVEAYYSSYTFDNDPFEMSVNQTFVIIPVDNQRVNYTVHDIRIIAGNIVGNTTLFFGDIEVIEGERIRIIDRTSDDNKCDGLVCYPVIGVLVVVVLILIVVIVIAFFLLYRSKQKVSNNKEGSVHLELRKQTFGEDK